MQNLLNHFLYVGAYWLSLRNGLNRRLCCGLLYFWKASCSHVALPRWLNHVGLSFLVCSRVLHLRTVYALYSWVIFSSRRRSTDSGLWSDWFVGRTDVIFYRWVTASCQRHCVLRTLPAVVAKSYRRKLVQRLWTSTVDGNPLAGIHALVILLAFCALCR